MVFQDDNGDTWIGISQVFVDGNAGRAYLIKMDSNGQAIPSSLKTYTAADVGLPANGRFGIGGINSRKDSNGDRWLV